MSWIASIPEKTVRRGLYNQSESVQGETRACEGDDSKPVPCGQGGVQTVEGGRLKRGCPHQHKHIGASDTDFQSSLQGILVLEHFLLLPAATDGQGNDCRLFDQPEFSRVDLPVV